MGVKYSFELCTHEMIRKWESYILLAVAMHILVDIALTPMADREGVQKRNMDVSRPQWQ